MTRSALAPDESRSTFYKWASALALITVCYNLIEGGVSVFLGAEDGTITLFGFGIDSFVEVISALGIWHMIRRMEKAHEEEHHRFERTALFITGISFYVLAVGLAATSLISFYTGHRPRTTFWSIVVGIISILAMWLLIHYKTKIGREFNSQPLLADAACTKTCLYLSIILLVSGLLYELTGIVLADSLGAVGIAIFSFREGREALEEAGGENCQRTTGCNQGANREEKDRP
ncbi:MAG TPA: cation transporter [Syntrophorhabdales bacterium]|nr:cation transporter [Syntrophorhabdales bacterium]